MPGIGSTGHLPDFNHVRSVLLSTPRRDAQFFPFTSGLVPIAPLIGIASGTRQVP